MGDIADLIIDGFFDMETGEVIDGDAPGYPRTKRKHRELAKKWKRFSCDWCDRTFTSKQGLRDHCRDKHPECPQ